MAFLLQMTLPSSFPTSSSSSSSSSSPLLFRSSPSSPLSFSTASTLFPPPLPPSSTLSCSFPAVRAQPPPMSEFASEAFESERLRLDAQARLEMKEAADAAANLDASSSPDSASSNDGAWKWSIRKRVWDMMERENLAVHPRPVHHRIPNFVGAPTAAAKLASLPVFQAANCVKVNPDTPQKQVRYLTLEAKKKLLTPQPRLRTGFFCELEASTLPEGVLAEACTALGVAKYGKPLGLEAELKVDLIVIGSVAVDPKTGARLGKGEGFAELEYGMLRHMGAIDDSTIVVTSIHDKQLVDDIPVEKLKIHDVPVDIICTPTRIIYTNTAIPKPKGIYWELLSPEKLGQIRVLRELKKKIEKETGTKLPVGPSEKLPPTAERRGTKPKKQDASNVDSVFVWNLDVSTSWRELKDHASKAGADVLKVNIIRKQGSSRPMAQIFLNEGVADVDAIVKALDRSRLGRATIRAKINVPRAASIAVSTTTSSPTSIAVSTTTSSPTSAVSNVEVVSL